MASQVADPKIHNSNSNIRQHKGVISYSYGTGYDGQIKSRVALFCAHIFDIRNQLALSNGFCYENVAIFQTSEEDREPTSTHHNNLADCYALALVGNKAAAVSA